MSEVTKTGRLEFKPEILGRGVDEVCPTKYYRTQSSFVARMGTS